DDLKDVIRTHGEAVVGRVTQNGRALRSLKTYAESIEISDNLGARTITGFRLFDRLRGGRAGHIGWSGGRRRPLHWRELTVLIFRFNERPERQGNVVGCSAINHHPFVRSRRDQSRCAG